MNCHISLRNGVVYMPTMGKMGKGFYRHQLAQRHVAVPQPRRRDDWPPPVVLKYAGVKSWPAFERGRQVWNLEEMTVFIGSPAIPRVFMGGWKFRSKQ
jgi:hypothetical protein